jgi:hypothetical protein
MSNEEEETYQEMGVFSLSEDEEDAQRQDFPLSPFSLCGVEEEEETDGNDTLVDSDDNRTLLDSDDEGTLIDSESESESLDSEWNNPSSLVEVLASVHRAHFETEKHCKNSVEDANLAIERAKRVIANAKRDIVQAKRVIERAKRNKTKARETRGTNLRWLREQITIVEGQIGDETRARTKAKEDYLEAKQILRAKAKAMYRDRIIVQ